MTTNKRDLTKPTHREAVLKAFLDGITNLFPAADTLRVDGTLFTKADLQAKVQSSLGLETAARQAHVTLSEAAKAKDANAKAADEFIVSLRKALVSYYGSGDQKDLQGYGVTPPRKPTKATSAQNVVKAAKASETRAARGTVGPKQKAVIKGGTPASVNVTVAGKAVPTFKAVRGGGSTPRS
jgi:hypothetical protein